MESEIWSEVVIVRVRGGFGGFEAVSIVGGSIWYRTHCGSSISLASIEAEGLEPNDGDCTWSQVLLGLALELVVREASAVPCTGELIGR